MSRTAARLKRLRARRGARLALPAHISVRTRAGRPLIQESTWKLKRSTRTLLSGLTVLAWTLWLALLAPVLTSLAWTVAIWLVYADWGETEELRGVRQFLASDLPLGVGFCLLFALWVGLRALFMRRVRRTRKAQALSAQAGERLAFPSAVRLQVMRCLHDEHGQLREVQGLGPASRPEPSARSLTRRMASRAQPPVA